VCKREKEQKGCSLLVSLQFVHIAERAFVKVHLCPAITLPGCVVCAINAAQNAIRRDLKNNTNGGLLFLRVIALHIKF
jgi:hypothetical protein